MLSFVAPPPRRKVLFDINTIKSHNSLNLMRMITSRLLPKMALLLFTLNIAIAADSTLQLPIYIPVDNTDLISGELSSVGSTTVTPFVEDWFKEFSKIYPNVNYETVANNSRAATEALINGSTIFGAMSRPISSEELAAFEKEKHYKPTEIKVSLDALGVIVNPSNPINSISKIQLDALYSRNRECGNTSEISDWRTLGWNTPQKLEVYFFSQESGNSGFFRDNILCGGTYRISNYPLIEKDPEMMETISKNQYALGYVSMITMNNSVKTLKVGKSKQHPSFLPTPINIANKNYPLTRYLYLYIDRRPKAALPNHLREFIKFIFSRHGQRVALSRGGFPLSAAEIGKQLNQLLF